MAKGARGGQRGKVASLASTISQTAQAVAETEADTTSKATKFDKDYRDFLKMTEDERIDAVAQAITEDVPAHLSNTDFQKVLYNLEFNDKPDVVDEKTLDSMNGTEMFRTVNSVYDRQHDINYTPKDIAQQIQTGSTTRTSDNGGSAYGRGIYFAKSYDDSIRYGSSNNDISKTAVVRAKLNSNAKIINYTYAVAGVNKEINSGTKLGKMLQKVDGASKSSIYALVKGYNVVDNGYGYIVVLNRKAMTMSKDIRPSHGYGKGW